ncbi:MAG: response regulator [Pirellulales bacterium]|nr:response regulator [Pirellulales bacterium]
MAQSAKILVIDDDSDIQNFCQLVLEAEGYTVLAAYSSAEGKTVMNSEKADLVILDVMMEEADSGFEAARWFAAEYPKVPVILFSSIADAADSLFDTSSLSVADLVNKPISASDLLSKLERLLSRPS